MIEDTSNISKNWYSPTFSSRRFQRTVAAEMLCADF